METYFSWRISFPLPVGARRGGKTRVATRTEVEGTNSLILAMIRVRKQYGQSGVSENGHHCVWSFLCLWIDILAHREPEAERRAGQPAAAIATPFPVGRASRARPQALGFLSFISGRYVAVSPWPPTVVIVQHCMSASPWFNPVGSSLAKRKWLLSASNAHRTVFLRPTVAPYRLILSVLIGLTRL